MKTLNILDHPISFTYPSWLAMSGWTGHIPFAMFLIDVLRPRVFVELGTQYGVSYCAFCQAVKELESDTTCYAVDCWEGDAHAGFYGPEVLAQLREHHDPLYSGFSRLVQSTFDEAVKHFSDESIDLLHIDGYHTYEAVKHDFETWLPKLSKSGVLLLHDINVRESDFGVWKLWDEIKTQYPSFEFTHSHGLGLLTIGQHSSESFQDFISASKQDPVRIKEFFYQLGSRLETAQELQRLRSEFVQAKDQMSTEHAQQLQARDQSEETLRISAGYEARINQIMSELGEARSRDEEQITIVRNKEREQCERLEEQLSRQVKELARQEGELIRQSVELARQHDELTRRNAELVGKSEELAIKLGQSETKVNILDSRLDQRVNELSASLTRIAEMETQLLAEQAEFRKLTDQLTEGRVRLHTKKEILDWMSTSRSWTLTAPLRKLSLLRQQLGRWSRHSRQATFHGWVDSPTQDATVSTYLEIFGWAYSTEAPIVRVEAFVDNVRLGELSYGEERLDVMNALPSQAPLQCGFAKRFFLDEFFIGHKLLLVRVINARGNFKDYTRAVTIQEPAGLLPAPISLAVVKTAGEAAHISPLADTLSASKKSFALLAQISLDSLLASGSTIEIPQYESPKISILVVLYNRSELTLQCLHSILLGGMESFEVVIVNNASTDSTKHLLRRIKGARIIENETNVHYLKACNQAGKQLRGEYILLLNNDAQLIPGSVSSALRTLECSSDIGAVGGKIVLPDGTLQEAGNIIWRDGSCLGYGRGDSPSAPPYMFMRDVDYCSGAFLLTKRKLFLEQGGFDEDYAPAYYEETDYCVRLWKQNKRVVYDPNAIVFHYEFASSGSSHAAINLQVEHQNVLATKHKDWLQLQCKPGPENILPARTHTREGQQRILLLDDRVPHLALGSGFPRSNRILFELVNMRHAVTFYPTNFPNEDWADVYQDIPREVEVMLNHGWDKLEEFFEQRANYYDLIFVSRPHNMARLKSLFETRPDLCRNIKIIYDAEALFSYREIGQLRLEGKELSAGEQQDLIDKEVLLAENCECVISVSGRESHEFSKRGLRRVHTLGHALDISPTENGFEQRRDILFVGAVHSLTSPNADSMYWFSEKILPLVQEKLGSDVHLVIAGSAIPSFSERFPNGDVKLVGRVDRLATYYNNARIFVAPTRFSAGIPLKVIEAAAHGLPVVATTLTGTQLGWHGDQELLLADDAEAFAAACIALYQDGDLWKRLRQNALKRVRQEYSRAGFSEQLKAIVGSATQSN